MAKKKQIHFQKTESTLGKYVFTKLGIENLEEDLRAAMSNNGVGAVDPGAEVFVTNKFHSTCESAAISNIESNNVLRLRKKLVTNIKFIKKIDKILNELRDEEEKIIRAYYFEGDSLKEIADKVNYSVNWCGTLKNKAVEKISLGLGYSVPSECKLIKEQTHNKC